MGKWSGLALTTIFALFVFTVCPLPAAEIAIIKSNDITPYNQAIEGFIQEIGADVGEYDLQGEPDRVPKIMDEVKRQQPKLVFALGALAAVKTKENISNIPIIYTLVLTPEDKGLTGGNITGISIEVNISEQLSIFKKVVSGIDRIGVLYSHLTENLILKAQQSCQALGLELVAVKLNTPEDVPDGIKELLARVDSLWLIPDSVVVNSDSLHYILLLTLENAVPFMVYSKSFVKAGALLSPVVSYTGIGRQAGRMAQQVLQGERLPAAILPPEGVEWAINLYVAQNMGLQIPAQVLNSFKHVYK